ncbi:hypothetical protein CM15mP35_00870 [bacterium]|nr:MAG: hypothetical protein CM15mP35_00870 [bacterium]
MIFEIIENGYADFVNGTRLIYGKEKNAMRFLNSIGNLFFQFFISIVIKQKLTDSLWVQRFLKRNLDLLYDWQKTNIVKDPFGDFDLIFSAAYSGQKILEYPVHYRSRKYGSTQISRFKDGWKLLSYFMISYISLMFQSKFKNPDLTFKLNIVFFVIDFLYFCIHKFIFLSTFGADYQKYISYLQHFLE